MRRGERVKMRTRIERTEEMVEQLPLVSVLIPTYNRPSYFEKALCSVLATNVP